MNKYRAFGLVLASEFPIIQVPVASSDEAPDVFLRRADLSQVEIPEDSFLIRDNDVRFLIDDAARFRITNGNLIEADCVENCSEEYLAVFLMGSCMGAILHQRGLLPIHGSCVTDGGRSVLITGDSGAGKSTLAAEFLANGWKLLTDDVSVIKDIEGTPVVQSSYPSQKLWQDSLEHYDRQLERIHSLYARDDREKYGVSVADLFYTGIAPLSHIVRLIPSELETQIQPIDGFARVHQLMCNTYRPYMIVGDGRQRHFQRCVTLSEKVPMSLVIRKNGEQCAARLYELICNAMEGAEK